METIENKKPKTKQNKAEAQFGLWAVCSLPTPDLDSSHNKSSPIYSAC